MQEGYLKRLKENQDYAGLSKPKEDMKKGVYKLVINVCDYIINKCIDNYRTKAKRTKLRWE